MKHKVSILLLVCLLVISLTGCGGGIVPSASDKGTIKGQVMIPVETKDISGWIPVANATVTFIDYEGVIHTVITDEDGYYIFEDFASGSLYCITATAQLDGKTIVFKDLIKDVIAGEDYDLGTADADSTALTLIVEELTDKGLTPEEIDLEEIQDSDSFGQLQGDISEVIENHENVLDNSDIINEVYSIADEYISPTPVNHAPTITSTQITTAIVNILYAYTVEATDPDGDTITYSLNIKPNEMNISSLTGGITWIPATSGNYNVTVNASDGDLSDTQSFTITVTETPNQSPTASFTADPSSGVAPLGVFFNASNSSDSDGSIISYAWDFKDRNTGNGSTINHAFSSAGSYNVELIVTDNEGATDSLTKTITVTQTPNQSPIASFTANPTSGIVPLEVSFNASSSSDTDGSITSYQWDFKDGDTGTGQTVNHTFSSTGSYSVKLTVTDNDGATDSLTKTITVTDSIVSNQSPTASFTANPTSGVAPLEVSFNASNSSDSDGSITSYAWDFKDGETGNGEIISHTFSSIGSYNVELTVTDDKGATDSLTKTITVTDSIVSNQSPTASFTANPTSGVAPLEVSFNASSSSDSDGSITSYDWDFKDGETGNGEIISHTFSSIGSYNVELTVTDDKGATDSTTKEIEVISGTQAGGIISENTTWTKQDSPYLVTDTVQIPSGVILTISPGVTVSKPSSGDIFLINGEIYAHGTPAEKIIFEGGNNSNFFNPDNSDINTFLDLEYCTITNGNSFWPPSGHEQYGAFSLKHCILENLSDYSYIWYPKQDVYIEYNQFINTGGFSVGQDDNIKVYIRYNLFDRKNPNLPSYADFCVKNWAAYSSSQTVVQNNSFINMNGIVLELPGGYGDAAMSAAENYWGTQEIIAIENMIYDKNDDITCAGYIQYEPILTEPHPDVP